MAVTIDDLALPLAREVEDLLATLRATSPDFRSLIARYDVAAPALRHYGLARWQAGNLSDAVTLFRAAVTLARADADLWRDLAGAYDAGGRADLATIALQASLALQPDHAHAWLTLAGLKSRAERHDEAEVAFQRALALDATMGEAHFGLGILHFSRRRLDAAVVSLEAAIANGYANAIGFASLGHVLYLTGSFPGCAGAFEAAARLTALDTSSRRKYAIAKTLTTMIGGHLDDAVAAYPELAGAEAQDPSTMLRDAFSILSGYGHHRAAAAVARLRLAQNPDDASQRYLLDARDGRALARAPVAYLESHFDGFAETFDFKLVDVLGYRAPEQMAQLIAAGRRIFTETLDLGCGTGLAAIHLAPLSVRLTGVDVSGRMLDQAGKRELYEELVKAEALAYLAGQPARFDLVFAADVLVYFGDLAALFEHVARAIVPGGLFAASIETMTEGDYKILPSGRFAHSLGYVERNAAPFFTIMARQDVTIRLEAGRPAKGLLLVMERR